MTDLPFHEYADIFPLIEGPEFIEFASRIGLNGLLDPIDLLDGSILDGRNRYRGLLHLVSTGEPLGPGWGNLEGQRLRAELIHPDLGNWQTPSGLFRVFDPGRYGDPLEYVISKNLDRRQLDDIQRASAGAKISNYKRGGDRSKPGGLSVADAARIVNVAPRQIERARVVHSAGVPEVREAIDRGDIALSVAEKIARMPEAEQPGALAKAMPSDHRAVMGSRREPDDSLDFFPTPPWATRALVEIVLAEPLHDVPQATTVWEPACGEGHMAEVLREYDFDVFASDIFDYGYGDALVDFLSDQAAAVVPDVEWIITNSPFGDKVEQFALRALERARLGVAMFVPLRWLETNGRYERLFREQPPTLISFFAERVNLCKGRWEPDGSTATAYIWLVWVKGLEPRAPFWIPPGCRDGLSHPDDVERFTAHPVRKSGTSAPVAPPVTELDALAEISGGLGLRTQRAGLAAVVEGLALEGAAAPAPASSSSLHDGAGATNDSDVDPDRAEHKALGFIDGGGTIKGPILDVLRGKKLIVGKATPKLTKAGKARLAELDEHFDRLMKLNALPPSVDDLVPLYGECLVRLNQCVLAADQQGADLELEHLELLQERANGNASFGMACGDSPAERLRVENCAPIGAEPLWHQGGVFRLVIEGVPHLLAHNEDGYLSVFAEDPQLPFLSETGYRSLMGSYALGHSVAAQAEAYIREYMAADDGTDGKRRPRKKPLPMPAVVYRLPAEAEGGCEPIHVSGSIWTAKQLAEMERVAAAQQADDDGDDETERTLADCRVTPEGQPIVPDIVKPGDVITTSYCSGPYHLLSVRLSDPEFEGCPPSYTLAMTNAKGGKSENCLINNVVAVDGRLLQLFADNSDEVYIWRAVPSAAPPEMVDGVLQCRIPLDDHEIEQQRALTAIEAGEKVEGEIVRDLVGNGYVRATKKRLLVTDEGRAWLLSLVDLPAEPPLDVPSFIEARP